MHPVVSIRYRGRGFSQSHILHVWKAEDSKCKVRRDWVRLALTNTLDIHFLRHRRYSPTVLTLCGNRRVVLPALLLRACWRSVSGLQ